MYAWRVGDEGDDGSRASDEGGWGEGVATKTVRVSLEGGGEARSLAGANIGPLFNSSTWNALVGCHLVVVVVVVVLVVVLVLLLVVVGT